MILGRFLIKLRTFSSKAFLPLLALILLSSCMPAQTEPEPAASQRPMRSPHDIPKPPWQLWGNDSFDSADLAKADRLAFLGKLQDSGS